MSSKVFAWHPNDKYKDDEYKENIVELQNNTDETMDTSNWLTHPVGRYLIKLPPTAQIKWEPLQFANRYELTWKKDLSYDGAISKLEEIKRKQVRDSIRLSPGSINLQENFSPQKRGTLLTVDYYTESRTDDVTYDMYVVNKKNPMDIDFPERIYYLEKDLVHYQQDLSETEGIWLSHMKGEKERSPNTAIATEKFISHVADNIAPHDPSLPVENVRGIYFEGGFLFDPLNENIVYPKDEVIWIEVTFIDYPGAILKIAFHDYPGLIAETHYLNDGTTPIEPGKTEENTTIAGEPANERLIFTKNDNTPLYFFILASPATLSYKPQIGMKLETPTYNDGSYKSDVPKLDEPSFESDKEAIAFWNAIKENIRWRPDNWKVKAPGTKRINQTPIIMMHLKNPTTGIIRGGMDTTKPPIRRPSFKSDEEAMAF